MVQERRLWLSSTGRPHESRCSRPCSPWLCRSWSFLAARNPSHLLLARILMETTTRYNLQLDEELKTSVIFLWLWARNKIGSNLVSMTSPAFMMRTNLWVHYKITLVVMKLFTGYILLYIQTRKFHFIKFQKIQIQTGESYAVRSEGVVIYVSASAPISPEQHHVARTSVLYTTALIDVKENERWLHSSGHVEQN